MKPTARFSFNLLEGIEGSGKELTFSSEKEMRFPECVLEKKRIGICWEKEGDFAFFFQFYAEKGADNAISIIFV